MTIETFRFLEQEIISVVNNLLDKVRDKNFSDYVLLLSRASYQVENEDTLLSPYVIQSNLEILQDYPRQRFLHTYLNQYTALLEENRYFDSEMHEYNINLQMMLYSHIWESCWFLVNLKRIVSILSGNGYVWKIPFNRTQRIGSSKKIPINKGKFILEEVLTPLESADRHLYDFLVGIYNSSLRNGYSHSMYSFDMSNGCLEILDSSSYRTECSINISDWEEMFCKSVLFSYHLFKNIADRLNHFKIDYPHLNEVVIKWPSYKQPGKSFVRSIYPVEINCDGNVFVEFQFTR